MKTLLKTTKERIDQEKELVNLKNEYEKSKKELQSKIDTLKEKESLLSNDLNLEKIEIAETILKIYGEPFLLADNEKRTLLDCAIEDVTRDFNFLRDRYFGNKVYSSFYQRCDCIYGMGPKHGSIVDSIELKGDRKRQFSDSEKEACIYYLMNYKKINVSKLKVKEGHIK